MKVVILCGGKGTRLSEETTTRPKPMVEIGGIPILIHLMEYYAKFGFNEFILALGHKGEYIKNYFHSFYAQKNDFTIDLKTGNIQYLNDSKRDWKVSLIDTGEDTLTGGRLLRLRPYLINEQNFFLTYGDGLSNIKIDELLHHHQKCHKIATVSSVRPVARFGEMTIENNQVVQFQEKPQTESGWINGGFFVFNHKIFNYLKDGDQTILERYPLEQLVRENELAAFQHLGNWQCMDTLRDKEFLENLWASHQAFWQ